MAPKQKKNSQNNNNEKRNNQYLRSLDCHPRTYSDDPFMAAGVGNEDIPAFTARVFVPSAIGIRVYEDLNISNI